MASKDPEDPINNTAGTDEETVALRRKRLRRVSFADREITSVHIFNRDEDYETPPNSSASKQQDGEQGGGEESEDKVISFFGELADGDDSKELMCSPGEERDGDADDEVDVGELFLRPKGSPSSGGSTVGSAATDDEENFFGPVSAHFIRPGRLSDSGASEENHDITMDSTAFSMHFRSLVMSEPGDAKTPTSSHAALEENTPSQVTPRTETGGVMVLTKAKKLFPKSPLPVDKVSGGRDSNDMSLVGDNTYKYDYACLSPTLEALLTDEKKALHPASTVDNVRTSSPEYEFSSSPQHTHTSTSQQYKEMHGTDDIGSSQIQTPDGTVGETKFLQQESRSQLYLEGASLSSSTSRRQDLSLETADVPKSVSGVTPSPKQHGFLSRSTAVLVESLSSIQKSQSKFGLIKVSSPASALLDRIEKSKVMLSGYRSVTTPSSIGRQGRDKGLQERHADIPITNLEVELSKHDNKTVAHEVNGMINQNNGDISGLATDINTSSADVQSLNDVFSRITHDETTKSQEEGSFLKQQEHDIVEENSTQETTRKRGLTESVSLTGEITFDFRRKSDEAPTPTKFVSSPVNRSNAKASSAANNGEHNYKSQNSEAIDICGTGDDNSTENCTSNNPMTVVTDKVYTPRDEAGLLSTETDLLDGTTQLKGRDSALNAIQNTTEYITTTQSPLKASNWMNVHSESPDKPLSNRESPVEVTENNYVTRSSPLVDGSKYEASLAKQLSQSTPSREATKSPSSLKKMTHIPPSKQLDKAPDKENARTSRQDISSLEASSTECIDNEQNEGSVVALNQTSESDAENIIPMKRKADYDHTVRKSSPQRSPKLPKSTQHILQPVLGYPDGNTGANCLVVREKTVNYREIPGKVLLQINQLFDPLAGKLKTRSICKLEDILVQLKKVHLCEILCLQIQSQKFYDKLSVVKTKRHAESRSLLCKLSYEKAKLQLLRLKQEMLQKKAQLVTSGIQKSEVLKMECSKLTCQYGERDGHVTIGGPSTVGLDNPEPAREVMTSKETEITREIKVLDSKIKNLVKSFHIVHKVTGDLSYVDTIAMLEELLKQKMRCRLILKDIQYWKVDSLNKRNGSHISVLNYNGYIHQRLTIKSGPVPCASVSNDLNDTAIEKLCPNMDVLIALETLFSTQYTKKYFSSKSLAENAQKTGLALHNLLDVAEELQLARMELHNLVEGNFISPSAGKLHLQITFADYRSSRKMIMILDMACLTIGNYPGDIATCQLLGTSAAMSEDSLSEGYLQKMKAAIKDVGVGYPRVLRLCRCVSRMLEA